MLDLALMWSGERGGAVAAIRDNALIFPRQSPQKEKLLVEILQVARRRHTPGKSSVILKREFSSE